jgi:hypothetical protein
VRTTRVPVTLPIQYVIERLPGAAPDAFCVDHSPERDPGVVRLIADMAVPVIQCERHPAVAAVRLTPAEAHKLARQLVVAANEALAASVERE